MAALGTAIRMTQTAQAVAGAGGGGEVATNTPGAPGATTAAPVATRGELRDLQRLLAKLKRSVNAAEHELGEHKALKKVGPG